MQITSVQTRDHAQLVYTTYKVIIVHTLLYYWDLLKWNLDPG